MTYQLSKKVGLTKFCASSDLCKNVGRGKVERDAALDLLAVLEVAKEAEAAVEGGDEAHAHVEDAIVSQHVCRTLHLKLCSRTVFSLQFFFPY